MSSLIDILDALATTLEDAYATVDIGSGITIQVVGRLNPNPSPPSIDIYPGHPSTDDNEGGGFSDNHGGLIFTVRARVSTADSEAGQDFLLALMDAQDELNVATALTTLGGPLDDLVSSIKVEGPSGYTQYVDPGGKGSLLGCDWKVTVLNLPAPPPS